MTFILCVLAVRIRSTYSEILGWNCDAISNVWLTLNHKLHFENIRIRFFRNHLIRAKRILKWKLTIRHIVQHSGNEIRISRSSNGPKNNEQNYELLIHQKTQNSNMHLYNWQLLFGSLNDHLLLRNFRPYGIYLWMFCFNRCHGNASRGFSTLWDNICDYVCLLRTLYSPLIPDRQFAS
jgi:hypothetical protein